MSQQVTYQTKHVCRLHVVTEIIRATLLIVMFTTVVLIADTIIMLRPYKRLSKVYDQGWDDFSKQYIDLIDEIFSERSVTEARILDIACGTGTLAIEFAKHGHVVHGIDSSPEMIRLARSKSAGLLNLSFDIQDMVQLNIDGKFDLVTCTYDSINYIRELSDLRKILLQVSSVLGEGGLFVFDSNTEHLYLNHLDEIQERELNGELIIQHCSYDSVHKEATTAFSFSDGSYEIHRQRPYDHNELAPLLNNASLKTIYLYSWFSRLPYSSNTPKIFCVTEKQ
ncbi:class I SAM-dependent DNA methyltransferase [Chloroflexota bacterium]